MLALGSSRSLGEGHSVHSPVGAECLGQERVLTMQSSKCRSLRPRDAGAKGEP